MPGPVRSKPSPQPRRLVTITASLDLEPLRGSSHDGITRIRIQRQNHPGHKGFRTGLDSLRRTHRARGRAQRPVPRLGRHRHRRLGLLRRSGADACHEPHRRTRCAPLPVPHHRAVFTHPRLAAHRPQRHHRRHGHHRGVHRRLSELQRPHPLRDCTALGGAGRKGLEHLLRRQKAPDAARRGESRCHQTALAPQ
ncbi:Uncharacterised protein [Mycobacteroides abscessus subsp. massiliense]|nr:Uncharacterised protein [Mycobacteroides abscessus subsp. massiliense]